MASLSYLATIALLATAMTAQLEVSDETLLPHLLVEAKATKVTREDGAYRAAFNITHVFKGGANFQGRTFVVSGSLNLGVVGEPAFYPRLKPGDTAIWLLGSQGDTLHHVPRGIIWQSEPYGGIIPLPARQGDTEPPYAHALAWARAVEETVKAYRGQRLDLLRKFTQSHIRPVAAWALAVLAEVDPRGSAEFFRHLIRSQDVGVMQKALAEQVLSQMEETAWGASQERLHLFERWVNADLSQDEARHVLSSLRIMMQHPPFRAATVLELVKSAARNDKLPAESRAEAVSLLLWVSRYREYRAGVFEFMLDVLKRSNEPEVELAAARVLRHSLLGEVQRRRDDIIALKGFIENNLAARLLQEALAAKPVDFGSERQ